MVKRRRLGHEECLREFGDSFKKQVLENLKYWEAQDKDEAAARSLAFELVLTELVDSANRTGVPLQDIGIEDFAVPVVKRQRE